MINDARNQTYHRHVEPRKTRIRFLISDAYTWFNKGDAAIVIGTLLLIKRLFPNSKVTVLSLTPEIDRQHYSQYDAEVKSRLFNTLGYSTAKKALSIPLFLARALLYLLTTRFSHAGIGTYRDTIDEYLRADVIISCGGGFLGGNKYSSIPVNLFPLLYSKLLGKRVLLLGQSVEPFTSNFVKWATIFVLNKLDLILVRERYSLWELKKCGIKVPMATAFDPAFLIKGTDRKSASQFLDKKGVFRRPLIGVTVRKWHFPAQRDPKTLYRNYLASVAKTIEHWVSERNGAAVIFPQVILEGSDDDRIVSSELVNLLPKSVKGNTTVLTEDFSPQMLKSLMGLMNVFIGTRMHSNIFAISEGVPTVSIAYEAKTYGIMEMLRLDDFVLDIIGISAEKLVSLSEEASKERNRFSRLGKKLMKRADIPSHYVQLLKTVVENARCGNQCFKRPSIQHEASAFSSN